MRKGYSNQLRLDSVPIEQVELILSLVAADINGNTRVDTGRMGMDYWHFVVLAAARLGCGLTYDPLQDLAENHRRLRAIMGLGDCDETEFEWRTIRNNICLLKPGTLA